MLARGKLAKQSKAIFFSLFFLFENRQTKNIGYQAMT
jgi:hypothetical protein